jgi:beta-galactosidase
MLGVCYYPEHWPEERWALDARLMREAGLDVVRIGEFAWSKMEPQEGQYDWGWLDWAIETLAAAGLHIILGTPTATPPAWLTERYPETLRVGADGRRWSHGGRRHTCPTSPSYRELGARIVSAMSERYGGHAAVIAWQIDNELSNHSTGRCVCDSCRAAFQAWCRERYETLENLNAAWGNVFWSQSYSAWTQIPLPSDPVGGGHNPSLQLAYRRFASDAHVDLVRSQVAILRANAPGRILTTNAAVMDDEVDWHLVAEEVDITSWDNYPHGFAHPGEVAFRHQLQRGFKRQPFWVMEQQAGPINWTAYNPPTPPGQVRLWTYQALLHDAAALLYFRWRACRFGQEQYHSGLLNHAARLARGYTEAQQAAAELDRLGPLERPAARVALLCSFDDAWTHQIDPHHRDFDYWNLLRGLYASLWERGIACDIVRRRAPLDGYQLVIAPAPVLIDEQEAQSWRDYVHAGGTLLLTCRSFVKNQDNIWTDQLLPAGLSELIGAEVVEWFALPPDAPTAVSSAANQSMEIPLWAETLQPSTAEVLLRYTRDYYAGQAALTRQKWGSGQALYLGAYPTAELLAWLWTQLLPEEIHNLPSGVELLPLQTGWALLNHTAAALQVTLPGRWRDRLSGETFTSSAQLEPFDLRLLEAVDRAG